MNSATELHTEVYLFNKIPYLSNKNAISPSILQHFNPSVLVNFENLANIDSCFITSSVAVTLGKAWLNSNTMKK